MYVTVVGGGNSTPIFAALAKEAGYKVAILTRRPSDWNAKDIGFVNDDTGYIGGRTEVRVAIDLVTADPAECIPQSDLIFLAGLPIHHNPEVLRNIKPHMDMKRTVYVGSICAYGGFNWVAAEALGEGNYSLFGTQLIPWCCGTKEYGRTGAVFGAKRLLRIATEGGADKDGVVSRAFANAFEKRASPWPLQVAVVVAARIQGAADARVALLLAALITCSRTSAAP